MSGYSLANVMRPDETDPAQMDLAAQKLREELGTGPDGRR